MTKPISGDILFKALLDQKCIILACNTRIIKGVTRGILEAAKEVDSAVIIEIARSECDLEGGYTGLTPETFARRTMEVADEVGHDIWALHADHIAVKRGDEEDIRETEELIASHIDSGFTSFAIDASHLFDFRGENVHEELRPNIEATVKIARFIENRMGNNTFGLEAEVGEIGREDEKGMVLTTPEESIAFVEGLNRENVHPQVLAVANGSAHGNIYDESGAAKDQVSIDIGRTREIAAALKAREHGVRIAQHGITGTPRELIRTRFPRGDIIKGNVGTFWQNIVHEVLSVFEPELNLDMRDWTAETFGEEAEEEGIASEAQLFGKYGKYATKEFFSRIYGMGGETARAIEARAYAEALMFFRAFGSEGSAETVRRYMKEGRAAAGVRGEGGG